MNWTKITGCIRILIIVICYACSNEIMSSLIPTVNDYAMVQLGELENSESDLKDDKSEENSKVQMDIPSMNYLDNDLTVSTYKLCLAYCSSVYMDLLTPPPEVSVI